MTVQVEINETLIPIDGTRVLTEQEFSVLAEYVRQYGAAIQAIQDKRQKVLTLEKKCLEEEGGAAPERLTEADLEALADLAEVEASRLLQDADKIQEKIDEIWQVCPEVVTGGGYSLHQARWNA